MKAKPIIIVLLLLSVGVGVTVITVPVAKSFASLLLWRIRGRTGTVYLEAGKNMMEKRYYIDGAREGVWILYDSAGREVSRSEYKNGGPWNGVCYIYDLKMWRGEYRDGHPWRGCLPIYDAATKETNWNYFIGGKEVGYEEYCKEWGVSGPGHAFAGLAYLGSMK